MPKKWWETLLRGIQLLLGQETENLDVSLVLNDFCFTQSRGADNAVQDDPGYEVLWEQQHLDSFFLLLPRSDRNIIEYLWQPQGQRGIFFANNS